MFKVILLLFLSVNFLFCEILVIQPGEEGKDTYICDCAPDVNNPNGSITHLYQGQFGTCFDRTLIEWDLSEIPSGVQIQSAIMELDFNTLYGSQSGEMVYYMILESWVENEVTFNTQPAYAEIPAVITGWPSPGEWHSVDITDFVQSWIDDPESNYGIYCHSLNTTGTSVAEFNSSDHPVDENHPKLTIEYTSTSVQENDLPLLQMVNFSAYPNPFNPAVTLTFYVKERDTDVNLSIFNVKGQRIKELVNERLIEGDHNYTWCGINDISSGIYIAQLKIYNEVLTKKIVLLE